jgi:hypothetical protein
MARTRAAQSQPQDASQEPRAEETPMEQGETREVNEVEAQLTGVEDLLNNEPARVPGDVIQGSGLVNGSGNAIGLINGGRSARGSDEASASPAPVDNPQHDINAPNINADPLQDGEGLRRLRERDAERRSRNLQAAQDLLERLELRQGLGDPAPQVGLNPGYAEGVAPMDEDEVNHFNNPPVVERAPSPEARNNRRRRKPTEADYLNPRVWRRRAPDGAQYMTPPRDFHPSDDEDEEAFRRSRQRPACQPEYIPQRLRKAVPNGREAERQNVNVPSVNHGQNLTGEPEEWVNVRVRTDDPVLNRVRVDIPPVNRDHNLLRDPGEWVRARVRAQDPGLNRGRARSPTPMPARPQNDENMEPQGPRMRSISLEPRGRPLFEEGGDATAPPPVYVPAARPLGHLPMIRMPEFKGKKGVPAQMWLESLPRFQNLYQLTDAQLLEVARFSCTGEYAALWAGLLPTDLTLQDFKDLFRAEFAVENHDKLMGEILKETQKGLVGEYATNLMRYFKVLDLGKESRVRHFVRGLNFGIKETIMASGPASFLQAVKKAKEVEQAYELGDNCPSLEGLTGKIEDQVVRAV